MPRLGCSEQLPPSGFRQHFVTTHWSIVLAAGEYPAPEAVEALGRLYQSYWYPLYAFLRRRGCDPESAQDLIQDFFTRLLEKNILSRVVRERGRFRSFLLTAMTHWISDLREKERARKRGGGVKLLSLDITAGEQRYGSEPSHEWTAEKLYERRWAWTLVENTLAKLKEEYTGGGKGVVFEKLSPSMIGEAGQTTYASLGNELHMTESAVKAAIYRLRQRYQFLFRNEVMQTLANPSEVEEEMRALRAIVSQ
jgi:DNA-directed RNA polymerase specialized sigma24 family protein